MRSDIPIIYKLESGVIVSKLTLDKLLKLHPDMKYEEIKCDPISIKKK